MPTHDIEPTRALSDAQIEQFIHDGFVRIDREPPLHPAEPFSLERADGDYSPVEIAIRLALGKA